MNQGNVKVSEVSFEGSFRPYILGPMSYYVTTHYEERTKY